MFAEWKKGSIFAPQFSKRGISSAGESACMACKRSSVRIRYSPQKSDAKASLFFCFQRISSHFYIDNLCTYASLHEKRNLNSKKKRIFVPKN